MVNPHLFRHTLGTRLINLDVPQEVARRILDHDSHQMTAHYARLSDTTIRRPWEAARKVNASGSVRLTCPMFITTADFLPQHREHRTQVVQIISVAEARGRQRLAAMNTRVRGNLDRIIQTLGVDRHGARLRQQLS